MEKSLIKKNIHLNHKEKVHVAQMIDTGATWVEVSNWHRSRFGKPMARSKFFRFKQQKSEILAKAAKQQPTVTNNYKRQGEEELCEFETNLKKEIARRTEADCVQKWTFCLLQSLTLDEKKKEPYKNMKILESYTFTNRF